MAQSTSAATLENLSRLALKPGVQSTLILSKVDGSIIRSTGLLASPSSTASEDASPARALNEGTPFTISDGQSEDNGDTNGAEKGKTAGHVAKTVFSFVNGAKAFADEMDSGDEVKLLRMRTKRNEIVIVPDAKFLLVVVHDTPLA